MVITTSMMIEHGACKFQTDIMDTIGGSLDTSNVPMCTAAVYAGLDLMWLARKFKAPNADIVIKTARDGGEAAKNTAKDTVNGIYITAKEAYDAILLVLTGQADPQKALIAALEGVDAAANVTIATAEATAFSSLFGV